MKMKHNFAKGGNAKVKSVGMRISIIISILLIITLGAKTAFDTVRSYNSAISTNKAYQYEETRKLAKQLEQRFISAYYSAKTTEGSVTTMMKNTTVDQRKRVFISNLVESMLTSNMDIGGCGVFFEPNAFDGKDAQNITPTNKEGLFQSYYLRETDGTVKETVIDAYRESDWYNEVMKAGTTIITQPYKEGDNIMTTYGLPIKMDGKIIGVVTADIFVTELSKELAESPNNSEDNFTVLVSDEGLVTAHSMDESLILKDITDDPEVKSRIEKAQQNEESELEKVSVTTGKNSLIIYVPVAVEGTSEYWVFESVISMSKMTAEAVRTAVFSVIINIVLIIVIAFVIMLLLRKMVSLPLKVVSSALSKLADYNLNLDAERAENAKYDKSGNEIAGLILSLRKLNQNLISIVSNINSHAQNTAATAEELTATAQSTSDAAGEVATAVTNIADGASSQAEDTQAAAASVETANRLLDGMMETLEELDEATDTIDRCKNDGNETLKDLVELTDENRKISDNVSAVIVETSVATEKISNASEMIQSISDQTNLLALNAAIEAARAGEAGKGFAVVAEEIRKLAENSSKFTENINQSVSELLTRTAYAVEKINESTEIVENQSHNVDEVSVRFDGISDAITELKSAMDEIVASNKQFSEAQEKLYTVMENASALSEENSASAEEISASTQEQAATFEEVKDESQALMELSRDLDEVIQKFKL